ncbi:MAG: cytochrome c1 [Betaproteobacteria bacterium]|nr:cytochrome c1 [Betaproteobacteria bacterium]
MKTIFRILIAAPLLAASMAFANTSEVHLDSAKINLQDQASLQRGARNFVNYCLNCHNAAYMRYSALTKIGLTEEQIKENLMFSSTNIGDTMVSALDPKDAQAWLGSVPPDLTLVARVRGSDWLYTFLRSFYQDDKSPSGWNNEVFPNVAMPHVLHDLQGTQVMTKVGEHKGHDGNMEPTMKLRVERAGTMSKQEYELFVRDLVNYLTYMGEPVRAQRSQLGVWVLFFLTLTFFLSLWLKNEYWKDVR